jgi:hypothetical protein
MTQKLPGEPLLSDYMFTLSGPHRQILEFYERNHNAPRFGYIDETFSAPTKDINGYGIHQGHYAIAMTIIENQDVRSLRDSLTDISGNYYHANESAQQRNIDMLNTTGRYTNMDTNIIAVHTSIPYGASEEETQHIMRSARNESLTALLKLATDREDPVKAFVIERTMRETENQKDRQTIQRLTRNNIIPPVNYVQVSSTAERNLWAADAVAYSMAQALLRSDLTLQEKSGIQLSIYDTQTLGLIDLKAPTNNLTSKLGFPTDPRQLRTEHLPHVTTGIAAREETLKNLRDNLRPGQRLLGPEKARDDLLYRKTQGIGRSRLMDPHHAADLTIGRGTLSNTQKGSINEFSKRAKEGNIPEGTIASFQGITKKLKNVIDQENKRAQQQKSPQQDNQNTHQHRHHNTQNQRKNRGGPSL